MGEILRTRKISPLTRKATSVSYKINTTGVTNSDTLRVEISHSHKSNKWVYTFDGKKIADKKSISFRVKDGNNGPTISWGSLVPEIKSSQTLKNKSNTADVSRLPINKKKEAALSAIKHSFLPVINEKTTVLIFGSLPGDESLRKQQYYANPRNQFWKIICNVIGQPLPTSYEDRISLLLRHNIGLWDVCHSANRKGSLDQDILNEIPNNITNLLYRYSAIKTILFNGAKAKATYDKYLPHQPGIIYKTLISSSGAATMGLTKKIDLWKTLINKEVTYE